jgi:amidase
MLAVGARAKSIELETATIADLQAAMAAGTLTSEKITAAYLARIAAYDQQGPTLNSIIALNPKALEIAKALDAERKSGKVRGPLHGIPIVLKDNFNTFDQPTTGGSQLLEGWIPPADAYVVKRLRDAGVVILAKVNLSEFAGGGTVPAGHPAVPNGFSSAGGQTRNPHDLTRGPAGSSGGTGAAIAAVFAQFGLGSDTGGSVRGPSSVNGIVGLKPTNGLLSRSGIIPLALSFDTGGPMSRNVYDLAVATSFMTGVDRSDPLTATSAGKFAKDYTQFLKVGALKGARIGVARDFFGKDAGTDAVMEAAIAKLRELGATIVDPLKYPDSVLQSRSAVLLPMLNAEFKAQLTDYLAKTGPAFPKTFDALVAKALDPANHYRSPEKADGLANTSKIALALDDPEYLAMRDEGIPFIRSAVLALFKKHQLDLIVYPTSPRPARPIVTPPTPLTTAISESPASIANLTGFPDLIVPAGVTPEGLPVTISFFGPAYSEAKLFGYAYDFEQATKARVLPPTTPLLAADTLVR